MNDLPSAPLSDFYPLPEGPGQYRFEFIEAQGIIKLGETDELVEIGVTPKADQGTLESIRHFHPKKAVFYAINPVELSAYLGKKMGEMGAGEGTEDREDNKGVLLDKLANDAPIVNLVNSICIDGIRSGASDIHIEAGVRECRVRYRLDGVLKTIRTIETDRFPAVASRIKIMANLNILERRQPQDGRITVSVGNENVDLRVSILPVSGGESIVLRILGKTVIPPDLNDLGFTTPQLSVFRELLRVPHGLILVTGPTGSGKTTTLNAMLKELVNESVKVVTIEDPVEFIVEGTNQIQINEQIGLGFDTILRRVLRQDPNIIMVGEIRDADTAEIAIRAALTGHLVLSTLHTNDAVSVIDRLSNMGVEPYLIASVLKGAIAQRLVRKLCPACARKAKPDSREKRILGENGVRSETVGKTTGCDQCGQSGYKGRTVIAEAFAMDAGLEELILEGARRAQLYAYLTDSGMSPLRREAAAKIGGGVTTFREVEREISFAEGE